MPFDAAVAEKELSRIGTLRIFENWTERDIADVAAAFAKVARWLPATTVAPA